MSIQNPIGEPPRDPYAEAQKRLDEKDRQEKEKNNGEPPQKAAAILVHLFTWMRGILDFLTKKPAVSLDKNLAELKNCLIILQCEDRSTDDDFLTRFSETWEQTLIISSHRKDLPTLRSFIHEIQTYPENQDYTLGYYLTEHAGREWIPVPYRELIQKIHLAHAEGSKNSPLTRWVAQIDQLLATAT